MTNFSNKSSQIPTLALDFRQGHSVGGALGMCVPTPSPRHTPLTPSSNQLELPQAQRSKQHSHKWVLISQREWDLRRGGECQ